MLSRRHFLASLVAIAIPARAALYIDAEVFPRPLPQRGSCGICGRRLTRPQDVHVLTRYARCAAHGGDDSFFNPRHDLAKAYREAPLVRLEDQFSVGFDWGTLG